MIAELESAVAKTNDWLEELAADLGSDSHRSYQALRSVLHALRDRLTVGEATDLAAQLPLVVRGIYYEGWNPSQTPTRERDLESFLQRIADNTGGAPAIDPERAARSVFK